jgi:hypothetical protein
VVLLPALVQLHGECLNEPQAAWASLGQILTTRVRRLISSLKRSSMLVDFMLRWCAKGQPVVGQRLLDVILDPLTSLGYRCAYCAENSRDVFLF